MKILNPTIFVHISVEDQPMPTSVLVKVQDACPFAVQQTKTKKKKSVVFSGNTTEKLFDEVRSEKKCPKENLPPSMNDVQLFSCKYGGYIDDTSSRMILVSNGRYNSSKVSDNALLRKTKILNKEEKKVSTCRNYKKMSIKEISENLLLDGNYLIPHLSTEYILDCILLMMEIYEHLDQENSVYTLSYKSGITISNKPGKRQRSIIKKKVEFLTRYI